MLDRDQHHPGDSLNLINGITGQFSLGHAGFMAIGAYVTGAAMKHWRAVWAGVRTFRIAGDADRRRIGGGAGGADRRHPDAAPARRLPRDRDARLRRDHLHA